MTPELNHYLHNLAGLMGLGILISGTLFIMWLFALVDVIGSEFENQSNKTMWILLLLFLAPLGALLYPLMSGTQKKNTKTTSRIVYKVEKVVTRGEGDNKKEYESKKSNKWF